MLKQIADYAKQILSLTRDTQQNKDDIKSLREENRELRRENAELRSENAILRQDVTHVEREMNHVRLDFAELTRFVERLAMEFKQTEKNAEQERRTILLEIENTILRTQQRLPPPETKEEDKK